VLVLIVVTGEGSVATASIRATTLKSEPVEKCIVDEVRSWTFPAPSNGEPTQIAYPFTFASAERP
jgi:hypothetical protein